MPKMPAKIDLACSFMDQTLQSTNSWQAFAWAQPNTTRAIGMHLRGPQPTVHEQLEGTFIVFDFVLTETLQFVPYWQRANDPTKRRYGDAHLSRREKRSARRSTPYYNTRSSHDGKRLQNEVTIQLNIYPWARGRISKSLSQNGDGAPGGRKQKLIHYDLQY